MDTPIDEKEFRIDEESNGEEKKKESKRPIIEFEGKKYSFSINSLVILAIGAPLVTFLVYYLFDWEVNYWLHEIVVKQTVFTMNLLFDMGMSYSYTPSQHNPWAFIVPGKSAIGFETFCTGVQAICVFAGIILLTPHSKDKLTNRDIIWRKAKSLIISSAIFYVVNILRMVIQLYLYYIGYAWSDIHYSISAASSFIAAIIVLLMHKYIPEFIISLIWTYTLIKTKIKGTSKKEKNSVSK
jgi:exosortase/archaeosortase family protein